MIYQRWRRTGCSLSLLQLRLSSLHRWLWFLAGTSVLYVGGGLSSPSVPEGAAASADAPATIHARRRRPRLLDLRPCEPEKQGRLALCVHLVFAEGPGAAGTTAVACVALPHLSERRRAPDWTVFAQHHILECNASEPCEYIIQEHVQVSQNYDVFCIDWNEMRPPFRIVPTCSPGLEDVHCGLQMSTDVEDFASAHRQFGVIELLSVLLIVVYVGWSYLFAHVPVVHETGLVVLFGAAAGSLLVSCYGRTLVFSYDMFSYILLPMVIFAMGFNLKRKNFFRYSPFILTFGLAGTFLTFVLIFSGPQNYIFRHHPDRALVLGSRHQLVMASVLAATDTVAPMAFLPASHFPRIAAVVLGESVLNDVVAMLLNHTVTGSSELPSVPGFLLRLMRFFAASSSAGLLCGVAVCLLFKWARVLHEGTVRPCILILLCNYACYIGAELLDLSAVCALFVCALLSSNYAQYSMSREALALTSELAEFMSYASEAFVFGYFGLTAVAYISGRGSFSTTLIAYYSVAVIAARCLAFAILTGVLRLLSWRRRWSLRLREVCVITMAGVGRGVGQLPPLRRFVPHSAAASAGRSIEGRKSIVAAARQRQTSTWSASLVAWRRQVLGEAIAMSC
eukprot:TRINITY_DN10212_c0_g1_i4.p1 TRINITY_DN10212_c0_g1~~TRINITY_DN10212_c0_g1_i4.p1  ORF type:complete len:623 (-),score=107.14 TRINITY_DN10212_c0_g1_i4:84-1952(-)